MGHFILLVLLFTFIILFITFKKIYVRTSTMAAVMALGITTQGVILNFVGKSTAIQSFGRIISLVIIGLWFAFAYSYVLSAMNKKFADLHISNKMNRFGIGTWIAGTSICSILIYKQYTHIGYISEIIESFNILLWILYIGISLKTLKEIIQHKLISNVHGILLLTTVSTQSIILSINTIFIDVPKLLNLSLLFIGVVFYVVCLIFILLRYMKSSWSIEEDWNNTNCILHGALSITGIACIKSGVITEGFIHFIWFLVLLIYLFVETIEIIRMIKRIKKYGLRKGIFIYDVSQWSRIFTFAMFYTFTSQVNINALSWIIDPVLNYGVWVVLALIVTEITLSFNTIMNTHKKSSTGLNQTN